jgi:alpha-galactosidase
VLTGDLSEEAFRFHATAIYATGGMILSGDDLTTISSERLAMLRKLQPPTGQAARFADDSLRVGTIKFPGKEIFCLFNWEDMPQKTSFALSRPRRVTDFWSGESLGRHAGVFTIDEMPAHSARLLVCS